nr:MAG TPA: hypothetical protein [Caudoviricetes sp.]
MNRESSGFSCEECQVSRPIYWPQMRMATRWQNTTPNSFMLSLGLKMRIPLNCLSTALSSLRDATAVCGVYVNSTVKFE